MNKFHLLGAFIVLAPLYANSFGSFHLFDGKVDYGLVVGGNPEKKISYTTQGHKVRIDTLDQSEENHGSVVIDFSNMEVLILIPGIKFYTTAGISPPKESLKNENFFPTGKKDFFLGHHVAEWVYKNRDIHGSFWMASDMGVFWGFGGLLGELKGGMDSWVEMAKKKELFPLKMDVVDDSKNSAVVIKAKKIEEKNLDPQIFDPPSDFRKFGPVTLVPDSTGIINIESPPVTIDANGNIVP